ncbi:MAG: hypothetical protein WBN89_13550 [Prochlorococcaceae cyanobacterium]
MNLKLATRRFPDPAPEALFNEWVFPEGSVWAQFYRLDNGFLLRFLDLADFKISLDGHSAVAYPMPGVNSGTVEHLYLNQVLPLMLSTQGRLVFHASAVAFASGVAVFAGESGRGKSTLAATFATSGHPFLTDDGLVLEACDTGYNVLPSHPSIRLWDDSSKALITPGAELAPEVHYTSKARFLAGDKVQFCNSPQPLRCVYFLGSGQAKTVCLESLKPSQALMEWVKHSFLLDIEQQPLLAAHFDRVAALTEVIPHYQLDYPRSYPVLPDVRQAILQHMDSQP